MSDEPLRSAVAPKVLLEHTDGLISAVQRYHNALARMMAAEYTIREMVDNALLAGVSPTAVRGIIDSFADAQTAPLLSAADVDPRLAVDDPELSGLDASVGDLAARRRSGTTIA